MVSKTINNIFEAGNQQNNPVTATDSLCSTDQLYNKIAMSLKQKVIAINSNLDDTD